MNNIETLWEVVLERAITGTRLKFQLRLGPGQNVYNTLAVQFDGWWELVSQNLLQGWDQNGNAVYL